MNPGNEALDIENMIYFIRGQKVMIDSDLATLYGVETKILNQAIKRNRDRFRNFLGLLTSGPDLLRC